MLDDLGYNIRFRMTDHVFLLLDTKRGIELRVVAHSCVRTGKMFYTVEVKKVVQYITDEFGDAIEAFTHFRDEVMRAE